MDPYGFITVKEAARFLGVSPLWIYARVGESGGPPYFRRGKLIRFMRAEFEQWAMNRTLR